MPGDTQPWQRPQANFSLSSDFSFFFLSSLPFFFLYAPGVNKWEDPVARKTTLYMKPFTPSQDPGFVHEKFSVKTLYSSINIKYALDGSCHILGCRWNEQKPHQNQNPTVVLWPVTPILYKINTCSITWYGWHTNASVCKKKGKFFIKCTLSQTTLAIVFCNHLTSMELHISLWFLSLWTTPTSHDAAHQSSQGNSWRVNYG